MRDSVPRLMRCPRCRIQFETSDTVAICAACNGVVDDDDPPGAGDDPAERSPTQPHEIIRVP